MSDIPNHAQQAEDIIRAGHWIRQRHWVPATSGNFSMRAGESYIAITVSGTDKGALAETDIMLVDMEGQSIDHRRPSAETGLHIQLYQYDSHIQAVLHTHSQAVVTLSMTERSNVLKLSGYELLKAFRGFASHMDELEIPIFENDQNIAQLSRCVGERLRGHHHVYLIRGHGLYTWGYSMAECERHLEAAETLLSCELNRRILQKTHIE